MKVNVLPKRQSRLRPFYLLCCFLLIALGLRQLTHHVSVSVPVPSFSILAKSDTQWYTAPYLEKLDPFQYAVRPREKKIRMLFLYGFRLGVVNRDRQFFDIYEAGTTHPNVEAHLWGANFEGYDLDLHFVENIERRYGCGYFDIVFTYYGGMHPEADGSLSEPEGVAFKCGTVFIAKVGDCNLGQCPVEHYQYLSNLTVVAYGFELNEVFSYDRLVRMKNVRNQGKIPFQLYGHIPDTAYERNYHPPARWEDKTEPVALFGKADDYYPLRLKVANAINDGTTFIKFADLHPPERPTKKEIDAMIAAKVKANTIWTPEWNFLNGNDQGFAASMRKTKICVFDSTVQMKAIRKYAQAALSGCVIAGELPNEHEEIFSLYAIELKSEWPIEKINAVIHEALQDEEELRRKASFMLAYARQRLSSTFEVDEYLRLTDLYRSGHRGYTVGTTWSSVCRRYFPRDSDPPSYNLENPGLIELRGPWRYMPPWCDGSEFMKENDL